MKNIVIDTNIIIYYLQDNRKWADGIERILNNKTNMFISIITEMELFAWPGIDENEKDSINQILDILEIVPLNSKLARIAGYLRQDIKVSITDTIIAATAKSLDLPLLTNNVKDFNKFKGINILTYKDL